MLSKTNSIKRDKYKFQPTKYDQNNNLYCKLTKCVIYKNGNKIYKKEVCKLTGLYNFETEKFEIIFTTKKFFNKNHKKLLRLFLKQYDWNYNL